MQIHNVNRPKGHNRFCGPAVISAVTKMTTNDAAALIRQKFNKKCVMGTHHHEVLGILKDCGILAKAGPGPRNVTLAAWLKATKTERTAGRVFLIVAGHHWQLVSGRRYVCGRLPKGEVVSILDDKVKRRARVTQVWELISDGIKPVKPRPTVKKPDTQASFRAKAKRLAVQYGIEIETPQQSGMSSYGVWPPEEFADEESDPFTGDHYAYDWREVLERVTVYVKAVCELRAG